MTTRMPLDAATTVVIFTDEDAGFRLTQLEGHELSFDVEARFGSDWIPAMCWPDGFNRTTTVKMMRVAIGWVANLAGRNLR